MKAYFFGNSGLFGAYHPPKGSRVANKGAVLCYPFGQEYLRSHRAFLQLAKLLNRAGLHVFRFDYSGTGDSMGETMAGGTDQWVTDICAAIDELRNVSGAKDIALVGLRLGATLAALAQQSTDVKQLILWSPVVNGKQYIDSLEAMQRVILTSPDYFQIPRTASVAAQPDQLLGSPLPNYVRASIESLNIASTLFHPITQIHLIESEDRDEYSQLVASLTKGSTKVDYRVVPDAGDWGSVEQFENVVMPFATLQTITSILCGGHA